jgi:putative DNA primase/helicase
VSRLEIDFDAIPQDLKIRRQWVNWKVITRAGKPAKVPFDIAGQEGDSSDPSRWATYSEVLEAYEKGEYGFEGLGFTFDPLDPYAGVDLDHCINEDSSIKPKAKAILDRLDSYSEISPSGKGVKIFLKAKLPVKVAGKDGKYQQGFSYKKPDEGIEFEVYYGRRFFTVTGNRLDEYSPNIEDRNEELTAIFKEIFKDRPYCNGDGETRPQDKEEVRTGEPLSSDAAERLQGLFEADPAFHDEFYTPAPVGKRSDAEFHLCARLWEAGLDEDEIYHIMSSSPQTKWLERDDSYRWNIIKAAVARAEESHNDRAEVEARNEAVRKAAPIELKDVADIDYDEDGKIEKIRFSPTFAAHAVLEKMSLKMSEDSEDIYRFTGQIYKPDGARMIDLALCDAAGDHVTGDKLREILRRIKNELLENPVVFDPNPYILGVRNGVADLLTGEVRYYRPEDLILDQIPVSFDPAARCPAFLAFLESITPNVSDRITLIDSFVATAIKEPLPYVLFLLGLGRNGKGIYERLLKKFFGQAAFRDMPLNEVSKNNFAAGGFYRKRGWIASETGKRKATIGTDFIKLTSGNGVIDGDRKNQSRIQFEPYFQSIVDTNTMPKIEDSSIGWMERFTKIDLPYVFVANPNSSNPLEKQRDPALFEKLSTPGELSGILNLLLFRSKVIGKSKMIHKRAGAEMFAEYAEQSSSVTAFLEMFCEYKNDLLGLKTPSGPIYEAYRKWCSYKVGEIVDDAYFGRQLKKFCGGREPTRSKDKDRKSITTYPGLIFDEEKCQETLEALRLSMSQDVSGMSQAILKEEEETQGQSIPMSEVSQAKLWNDIRERFGDHSTVQKDGSNSLERESANLHETLETPQTSASGKLVGRASTRDNPETLPETNQIEADLLKAEEARAAKEAHVRAQAAKYAGKPTEPSEVNAPEKAAGDPPSSCLSCGEDTGPGHGSYYGGAFCASCGPKLPMVRAAMKAHHAGITLSELWQDLSMRGRAPRKEHLPDMLRYLGCMEVGETWRWVEGPPPASNEASAGGSA